MEKSLELGHDSGTVGFQRVGEDDIVAVKDWGRYPNLLLGLTSDALKDRWAYHLLTTIVLALIETLSVHHGRLE